MSLRVHPFLYEMSGAPCKFSFCAEFSSYDLKGLRDSDRFAITEQNHVFCILISKVILSI